MSRVQLDIGRLNRGKSFTDEQHEQIDQVILEDHEVRFLLNGLAKLRDRESMPHNVNTIDLVSDALTKAAR